MKAIHQLCALFFGLLLLAGCTNEGDQTKPGDTDSAAVDVQVNKARPNYNLQEGDAWRVKGFMRRKMTLNVGSPDSSETTLQITMARKYHVNNMDKEGGLNLTMTFLQLHLEYEGEGKSISYDSEGDPSGKAMGYEALAGKQVEIRMDPVTGQILSVRNSGPAFAAFGDGGLVDRADELMREILNEDWYIHPDGPVEVGDTWQRKGKRSSGLNVAYSHTYTFTKQLNNQALYTRESSISPVGAPVPLTIDGLETSYFLKGTRSEQINVDDATGKVLASTAKENLKGNRIQKTCPTCDEQLTAVRIETDRIIEVSMK